MQHEPLKITGNCRQPYTQILHDDTCGFKYTRALRKSVQQRTTLKHEQTQVATVFCCHVGVQSVDIIYQLFLCCLYQIQYFCVLCTKPTITIVIKVSNITSEQTRSEIFRIELASDRHESHRYLRYCYVTIMSVYVMCTTPFKGMIYTQGNHCLLPFQT